MESGEELTGDDGIGIECMEDSGNGSQAEQADTVGTPEVQKQTGITYVYYCMMCMNFVFYVRVTFLFKGCGCQKGGCRD